MKNKAWRTENTRKTAENESRRKKKLTTIIIATLGLIISLTFAIIISNFFKASASNYSGDSQESSFQDNVQLSRNCYARTEKRTTTTTTRTTTSATTTTTTMETTTTSTTTTTTTATTIITTMQTTTTFVAENSEWNGEILNSRNGRIEGPSGQETYYNLPMGGVVSIMRNMGFDEENYPYWVRDDGVKMLGQYVMCAANLELRPRGSVVQSSLGAALVCDTGGFAYQNTTQLDIAVAW